MPRSADSDNWANADDRAVVDACVAGRWDLFELLVSRYQATVYRVCYRFAGNHEDASDLTQDVFLRAYRSLASFRRESTFKTWIYRIAVNVGLTRVALHRREEAPLDVDLIGNDPQPDYDEELDRPRRHARVRAAVDQLPPRQRAAIVLRVFEGLSHEEAARVLGCSVGTVKANMFHALRRLRALLKEK